MNDNEPVYYSTSDCTEVVSFLANNEKVVTLGTDGTITWHKEYDIDAAASAFGKCLQWGLSEHMGLDSVPRTIIINSIFDGLIARVKEQGSLTLEDLTYERDCCTIIETIKY